MYPKQTREKKKKHHLIFEICTLPGLGGIQHVKPCEPYWVTVPAKDFALVYSPTPHHTPDAPLTRYWALVKLRLFFSLFSCRYCERNNQQLF